MKAIVTGHSRGLGAAMTEDLLSRGASVLGLSRSINEDLQSRHPSLLQQVSIDMTDPANLIAWLDSGALAGFLENDEPVMLVNNAGIVDPIGPAGSLDHNSIARAVGLNVTAPLLLADAFIGATSGNADRRVLHVSSGAGRKPYAGWSIYCATKAALDHHAASVVQDKPAGLRISSVAPGVIDTDMQNTIRSTPADRFVLRDDFVALKETGSLTSPEQRGKEMIAHLLADDFGQSPIVDIRDFAA